MVAHAFNPNTWGSGYLSLRPAWSIKQVPDQPRSHSERNLSKKKEEIHIKP